jgi:FkbM family methyltransferase
MSWQARSRFVRGLMQRAVRTAYPFGVVRKIRRGFLKGMKYRVAPAMGFTFAWGIRTEQWRQLGELVRSGECAYDIGANRGQSTLHLWHAVGTHGAVVAFEPIPENYEDLKFNLRLNSCSNVCVEEVAATAHDGECAFLFDESRPTEGRLEDVERSALPNPRKLVVKASRLDSWRTHCWPSPHLLKIDVEGGAGGVLLGAQELIKECRPVIYVELHGLEERRAIASLLRDHGYMAFTLEGKPVNDPTTESSNSLVCRFGDEFDRR